MITSDWHVGSRGWSEQAYKLLLKDIDKFNIKHVLHIGDLIQGRGVHRQEAMDLLVYEIDAQEDMAIDYLSPIEVPIWIVPGNHEEKIQGSVQVGHNSIKTIAKQLDNVTYCGYVAKLLLDKKYTVMMKHTSGGGAYAISYRAQKIYDNLVEKPDLLVKGHTHQLYLFPHASGRIAEAGTLQRENSWLMDKGITAMVGWMVIEEFTKETTRSMIRMPRVY